MSYLALIQTFFKKLLQWRPDKTEAPACPGELLAGSYGIVSWNHKNAYRHVNFKVAAEQMRQTVRWKTELIFYVCFYCSFYCCLGFKSINKMGQNGSLYTEETGLYTNYKQM